MNRIALLSLLVLSPALSLADSSVTPNAPVINFKLPVLNDQGIRTSLLRGSEARYVDSAHIALSGMQYTTFVEDGSNKVDSTLLAPTADVVIDNNTIKVHGEETVRLIRSDVDVTGEKWTYTHETKNESTPRKIVIERNVRVVFRTELKDILK
jgi:hypothetical protein